MPKEQTPTIRISEDLQQWLNGIQAELLGRGIRVSHRDIIARMRELSPRDEIIKGLSGTLSPPPPADSDEGN